MPIDFHETLSFLLVQVSRAHRTRVAAELESLGLYVGQEILLKTLEREDGLTQSEVAHHMDVEPPTGTSRARCSG